MAKRIQLSRRRGWRLPVTARSVARPTKWGNPYVVGRDGTAEECVLRYEKEYLPQSELDPTELKGFDLACWCALDGPCHADVLLRLANPQIDLLKDRLATAGVILGVLGFQRTPENLVRALRYVDHVEQRIVPVLGDLESTWAMWAVCQRAWQRHPAWAPDPQAPLDDQIDPVCRAVYTHDIVGDYRPAAPISVALNQSVFWIQFSRVLYGWSQIAKKARGMPKDALFRRDIEPLHPEDPPPDPYFEMAWIDLPTPGNLGYLARSEFKRLWPRAAKLVNLARQSMRIPVDRDVTPAMSAVDRRSAPITRSKKRRFMDWAHEKSPDLVSYCQRHALSLEEIWQIANNKVHPRDVASIGIHQLSLPLDPW